MTWHDYALSEALKAALSRAEEKGCKIVETDEVMGKCLLVHYVGLDGRFTLVGLEESHPGSHNRSAKTISQFLDLMGG